MAASHNELSSNLLQALKGSMDQQSSVRNEAEGFLTESTKQEGFGVALAHVALERDADAGIRQLAAVLLKRYAMQHWEEGDEAFVAPVVRLQDKAAIKYLILQGLGDADGKLRTAFSAVVAAIFTYDWPERWPELMPVLIAGLGQESDPNSVAGAVRCLSLIADDLADSQLPDLVPVLFLPLYSVASKQTYPPQVRRGALSVFHSCISTLGMMNSLFQVQTRKLVDPMIPSFLALFAEILSQPLPVESPDEWGIHLEVVKCLMQMVFNFEKSVKSLLPKVLGPLWQTFVSGTALYEQSAVKGEKNAFFKHCDDDGTEISLNSLVVQEFEFLSTLAGYRPFSSHVKDSIESLTFFTITYLQVTTEQEELWADANQFVSDEDNYVLSARSSGTAFLEDLVEHFGVQAVVGIVSVVVKRLQESSERRAAGDGIWWKLREAALLSMCTVSDSVVSNTKDLSGVMSVNAVVDQLLVGEDLSAHPLLHSRVLLTLSKLCPLMSKEQGKQLLDGIAIGLAPESSAVVKVGSLRALSTLCEAGEDAALAGGVTALFQGLLAVLQESTDEVLHLALEALAAFVSAVPSAAVSLEPHLTPALLHIWSTQVNDPVIGQDALEVIEALAAVPRCLEQILTRTVAPLSSILTSPDTQPDGLVSGAIDLVTLLLKSLPSSPSPSPLLTPLLSQLFAPVIAIAVSREDASELQNSAECLTAFLRAAKHSILTLPPDLLSNFPAIKLNPNSTSPVLDALLQVAARLLDPSLSSSASFFNGQYLSQLVRRLPSEMAPLLGDLMAAMARKMEASTPSGKAAIIVVFSRLVHLSYPRVNQLLDILAGLPSPNQSSAGNALQYVLSQWTQVHSDVVGALNRKLSVTALCLLLTSGDYRLAQVQVPGRLLTVNSGVIMTRSKTKKSPDQWTTVPFPVKVLSILADKLVEMKESGKDEDWEEYVEEEEDGAEEGAVLSAMAQAAASQAAEASGVGRAAAEDAVMELLKGMEVAAEEEDDPEDDDDPMNEISLSSFLAEYLQKVSQSHPVEFTALCQELTLDERKVIEDILKVGS